MKIHCFHVIKCRLSTRKGSWAGSDRGRMNREMGELWNQGGQFGGGGRMEQIQWGWSDVWIPERDYLVATKMQTALFSFSRGGDLDHFRDEFKRNLMERITWILFWRLHILCNGGVTSRTSWLQNLVRNTPMIRNVAPGLVSQEKIQGSLQGQWHSARAYDREENTLIATH